MFRKPFLLATLVLVPLAAQTLNAQTIVLPSGAVYQRLDKAPRKAVQQVQHQTPARFAPAQSAPLPIRRATQARQIRPQAYYSYSAAAPAQTRQQGHYPQLNAPLYPAPVQNVPIQVGGTAITNQAFAPHEMLYPHKYHAMYPPFYYRVRGGWLWTPFGIESHDKWELQGTQVKVNYRSTHNPFAFFIKPFTPRINLREVRD